MNLVSKMLTATVSAAAIVAMTACGGGGGGGSSTLATGGFIKTYAPDTSVADWTSPFNLNPRHYLIMYTADELQGSGNIDAISFRLSQDLAAAVSCPGTTIKIGHTTSTDLASSSTFSDHYENGAGSLMTVLDNRTVLLSTGLTGEFVSIPLDSAFAYNGVDNLVVDILRNDACDGTVHFSAENNLAIDQMMWTSATTDLTASSFNQLFQAGFHFSGGDNTQYYGTGLDHAYPLTTAANLRLQNMYMAADINGSGPVTGYALRLNKLSVEGNYTMTVKMGHTSSDVLSATFADNADEFVTVAQDVTVHVPAGIPAGGWVWIPLNGTFNYNGTDNLVVDFTTSAGQGNLNYVEVVDLGGSQRVYGNNVATGTVDGYVNNAKFRFNGAGMSVLMSTSNEGQAFPFWATVGSMQHLYSAYQLGSAGTIDRIECRANSAQPSHTGYDYNVTMAHTTAMDLGTVFADNLVSDKSLVFSGIIDTPAVKAGDWVGINLTKPFKYDGVSNLVLEIRGEGGSGGIDCRRGNTPNQQLLWGNYDAAATSGSTEAKLVDTRFYFK
ncbi:hypothetical protein WCX49_01815 [Sulfurimonas sp. HSL-1656]|uniref:hypothetical protein n=1 Tax=Thiomicrolovo subterrani TaxID=3131934 RepID=UPI0031FA3D31